MTNIILCGGSGTRLWPLSRKNRPKQFLKLFDDTSLFELCVQRNKVLSSKQMIVSNTEQYFLAYEQLENMGISDVNYLLEPVGRNTAPAIALACFSLESDAVVLVTPSDHLIKEQDSYIGAVSRARELAQSGFLVTFGIAPKYAETGYGYIEADGEDVRNFHEKPDSTTAQKYLEAGNYFWNSGIFCFQAGVFLEELKTYSPHIYEASKKAFENTSPSKIMRVEYEDMMAIAEDSIDYAVMEKSPKVKMVQSDIEWSDLGSFEALYEEMPKDGYGNALQGELYQIDAKNNMVIAKEKTVALIDVENLIIVDTEDALFISKRGSSQKIKNIISELKTKYPQKV